MAAQRGVQFEVMRNRWCSQPCRSARAPQSTVGLTAEGPSARATRRRLDQRSPTLQLWLHARGDRS